MVSNGVKSLQKMYSYIGTIQQNHMHIYILIQKSHFQEFILKIHNDQKYICTVPFTAALLIIAQYSNPKIPHIVNCLDTQNIFY